MDCQKCKDWHNCEIPPIWFNYLEIRFCPYQCLWIIANAEVLRDGRWPQDPENPNDNNSSRTNIKTEASFVKPELIIGEIEARLETVDNKGELLITQVEDGRSLDNLSDGAWAILMYIKGWRRKAMSFRAWKRQRKYRQNEHRSVIKTGKA